MAHVGSFFALGALLGRFLSHVLDALRKNADVGGLGIDFQIFWEGFWEDLGTIFQ